MTGSLQTLADSLSYEFRDPALLEQALTHRSSGNRNNERLEFLGDAFLGSVIAEELYQRYPKASEGRLSRLRANLVRRETLAELARSLDLGASLRLGPGELKSGGHRRNSILADSIEAIFGAILLDGGFDACRHSILGLFAGKLDALQEASTLKDSKTRLQEYLQARRKPLPEYTILEVAGDAHAQSFLVRCAAHDPDLAPTEGRGDTRRRAEQDAAGKMLEQLNE